jgi:hypothetical protein
MIGRRTARRSRAASHHQRAAGPLNGPSQWLFGRRAAHRREADLAHTVTGYAIHHATSVGWAWVFEAVVYASFALGLSVGGGLKPRR